MHSTARASDRHGAGAATQQVPRSKVSTQGFCPIGRPVACVKGCTGAYELQEGQAARVTPAHKQGSRSQASLACVLCFCHCKPEYKCCQGVLTPTSITSMHFAQQSYKLDCCTAASSASFSSRPAPLLSSSPDFPSPVWIACWHVSPIAWKGMHCHTRAALIKPDLGLRFVFPRVYGQRSVYSEHARVEVGTLVVTLALQLLSPRAQLARHACISSLTQPQL